MAKRNSNRHSRSRNTPAVAYYRMSSDKQEASIPAQMKAVEQYAEDHGYNIVRDYRDEGISGDATEKRIQFQRMMQDAKSGDFEVILCWDQDRFGRFDPIEGGYWIKPMRDAGVRLETIAQGPIDWNDFAGRIAWTVQQEAKYSFLADLSRNVLRGHYEAAKRGEWLGGKPPLGYQVEEKHLVLGDPDECDLVRRIFRDYDQGHSLRGIAGALNSEGIPSPRNGKWTGTGIRWILGNRVYVGDYVWNKSSRGKYNRVRNGRLEKTAPGELAKMNSESEQMTISDNHPAIIKLTLFDRVQQKIGSNQKRTSPSRNPSYLMTGIVVCGECGSKMYGSKEGSKRKYCCSGFTQHGHTFCSRNAVPEEKLVGLVCDAIQTKLLAPDRLQELRDELHRQCRSSNRKSEATALERKLVKIDSKLSLAKKRLLEVDSDMVDAVQEQVRDLRRQREQIERSLAEAMTPVERRLEDHDLRVSRAEKSLHRLREAVQRADARLAREFLSSTISEVRLRFQTEQRGKRQYNFVERGTVTLSGPATADLTSSLSPPSSLRESPTPPQN